MNTAYAKLLRSERLKSESTKDAAHTIVGGKESNIELHNQIMSGVDDSDCVKDTYNYLKASGASNNVLALFN